MSLLLRNAAKQNERPISRDDRGFVLVCVFLGFLAEGEPVALPSAKHEVKQHRRHFVRFRQLPRQGPVSNNNYTRPSALADTRGCYQLAKQEKCSRSPGRPAAASQWKMATRHVLKCPDPGLPGSPSVAMREGPRRFRVVAAFQVVPVLRKRTTDDDATTTTRKK